MLGDPAAAERAAAAGMASFLGPKWRESTTLGSTTITAVPARHQVRETTFVLSRGDATVYFAGDSLYIPELDEVPARFGPDTVALLPTSGLRIRPLLNRKVVMDPEDAGRLTAVLDPDVAVPHHYAFTSGPLGDRLLTAEDRDPENCLRAAARHAPRTEVRILPPAAEPWSNPRAGRPTDGPGPGSFPGTASASRKAGATAAPLAAGPSPAPRAEAEGAPHTQ